MKNDNNKIYEKALNLYNNGNIVKAIELCEKGISNSLKDAKILNLKGLLLYTEGKLEEATALWKINKDYNDDSISKSYLDDSKNDFKRYLLCRESKSLIENLYIDEALENLLECSKSDFNLIEVNNLMALAYMKKGQYDNSRLCLEKVFNVDKKNQMAKETSKEINELLDIKDKKALLIGSLSLIVILFLAIFIFDKVGLININLKDNENKEIISFRSEEENNKEDEANNKIEDNNLIENNPSKETNSLVDNKKEINDKDKNKEEVVEIEKEKSDEKSDIEEVKLLTKSEIQKNYSDASYYFKEKEYSKAIKLFEETKKSSQNNHLDDDILFFLGVSYQAIKEEEKAIETYKDFLLKYEKGNYVEETFYRIILLYEDKDINASKEYSKKFIEMYPSSIYNNNKIKDILNR